MNRPEKVSRQIFEEFRSPQSENSNSQKERTDNEAHDKAKELLRGEQIGAEENDFKNVTISRLAPIDAKCYEIQSALCEIRDEVNISKKVEDGLSSSIVDIEE